MKFFSFLKNPFAKKTAPPPGPLPTGGGLFGSGGGGFWGWNRVMWKTGSGAINYREHAGEVTDNSIVAALLAWLTTALPMAPIVLVDKDDPDAEPVQEHPIIELLRDKRLLSSCVRDLFSTAGQGNAYVYIVPMDVSKPDSEPVSLQHLPAGKVTPKTEKNQTVAYYEYTDLPGVKIPPSSMLHFRTGTHPDNEALGYWLLGPVLPEIAIDCKACDWQWGLLNGGAVPPWVIGPKATEGGAIAKITQDDADFVHQQMDEREPGQGVVFPTGFDFHKMGFAPREMVMDETRIKAEERIAAQFSIPPVVAGLGAGLKNSTFNNYEQAVRSAWQDGVAPMQDVVFVPELEEKLLSRFADGANYRIAFDRSQVPALKDDETADADNLKTRADAADVLIRAGFDAESVTDALGLPDGLVYSGVMGEPVPTAPPAGGGPGRSLRGFRNQRKERPGYARRPVRACC